MKEVENELRKNAAPDLHARGPGSMWVTVHFNCTSGLFEARLYQGAGAQLVRSASGTTIQTAFEAL